MIEEKNKPNGAGRRGRGKRKERTEFAPSLRQQQGHARKSSINIDVRADMRNDARFKRSLREFRYIRSNARAQREGGYEIAETNT